VDGRERARGGLLLLTATLATLASLLSGCTSPGSAEPPAETQAPEATPSDEPTEAPETPRPGPTLDTNGSALQNLDYFDAVNERLIAEQESPDGRAFIDSLIAAGFAREAMEVTPDRTAVGLDADNIQFSVRLGDECLIGQFGNTGYVSAVADALATGKCLVGKTRPIDW
jgi:hypothetical protein